MVDAISAQHNPITLATREKADGEIKGLQPELEAPEEIMLFENKVAYSADAPRLTAGVKPHAEHAKAAGVSAHATPAMFTFTNDGRFVVATGYHAAGGKTELASALAGAENNKGSGDKNQGGNTYTSAQKSMAQLREEKLEATDVMDILSYC